VTETLSSVLPPDLESEVHRALRTLFDHKLTVATAESCTGGLLASILTDVDGYGRVFERGFVAYTETAKHEMLGVAMATLQTDGAVSEATAVEMAHGALAKSTADIGVAITGFAGPAGPHEIPGLVYIAAVRRGGDITRRRAEFGPVGRGEVRIATLRAAIEILTDAAANAGAK
jgi:nicotinamide-nucleotide amidase